MKYLFWDLISIRNVLYLFIVRFNSRNMSDLIDNKKTNIDRPINDQENVNEKNQGMNDTVLPGVPTDKKDKSLNNLPGDEVKNDSIYCTCPYLNDPESITCVSCLKIINKMNVNNQKEPIKGDNQKEPIPGAETDRKKMPDQQNTESVNHKKLQDGTDKGERIVPPAKTGSAKDIIENKPKKFQLIAHPYKDSKVIDFGEGKSEYILTRDLLDPDNTKISGEHAEIAFKNGKWVLKDTSRFKETYVRVSEWELKDGDEILFGNRFFKFHSEE
jgi:hypothetical protein